MIQAAVSRVSPATETKGKTIRRWQAKNTTSVIDVYKRQILRRLRRRAD